MRYVTMITAIGVMVPALVSAQTTATTEEGRTVELREDGTWSYVDGNDSAADSETDGSKTEQAEATEESATDDDAEANDESASDDGSDYDFRETRWGMSRSEVIDAEGTEPTAAEGRVIGFEESDVVGFPAFVYYVFADDKLVRAKYVFAQTHTNETEFVGDFRKVKRALSKKYGGPTSEDTVWKNDLYRDDRQEWGTAIAIGHLAFTATWNHPKTRIDLVLHGDNYNVRLVAEYTSQELKHLEDEVREQKATDAL